MVILMQMTIYDSANFQLEVAHSKFIESLSLEYLQMLSILYGSQIYNGEKRTSDYNNMTMLEVADELRIRTLMMKGDRIRRKKQLREEHAANEAEMMERLKRSKQ